MQWQSFLDTKKTKMYRSSLGHSSNQQERAHAKSRKYY